MTCGRGDSLRACRRSGRYSLYYKSRRMGTCDDNDCTCFSFARRICLIKTKLTLKEKLYCVIAYLPKATVQAAIGSVPLSLGLPCGNIVLSVAVLSILVTAPLGAIGMDLSYKKLLKKN